MEIMHKPFANYLVGTERYILHLISQAVFFFGGGSGGVHFELTFLFLLFF